LIGTRRAHNPNPALEHADWLDEQPDAVPVFHAQVLPRALAATNIRTYSYRPVPLRRPGFAIVLVARWIGIVSAAGAISPVGSSADGGSADTYRHTTTYGRAAVNTGAIGASAIANAANANVTNANAANAGAANASAPTAICEGII
jgi:hypothetical protein